MAQFSSRPPFSNDPLPYANARPGVDNRYPDESTAAYFSGDRYEHRPRPAFDRPQNNPTNPVLTSLRKRLQFQYDVGRPSTAPVIARTMLRTIEVFQRHGVMAVSSEQLEHARKVLTRLANFGKEADL